MKSHISFILSFLLLTLTSNAQSSVEFKVTSLNPGDVCTVYIQKNSEMFFYKKLVGGIDSTATYTFNNLSNGKWAITLDATGYYYPTTQILELNNSNKHVDARLKLITLANNVDYFYQWEDDNSYIGHAQQSYINGDRDLVILNNTIEIPDDFASVNLLNKHGIALSDKITPWTSEDAYRLFQMVKKIPTLAINNELGSAFARDVKSIWSITDDEIVDDIKVVLDGKIKHVTISRKAFIYATPLIAELDGIKGRFFSKRLYHAILSFATDFGKDSNSITTIAKTNFGITFLDPNMELQNLMNEDRSNFQSFSAFEKLTILSMFEEMPEGMNILSNFKYLVRRVAGQQNPKYPNAAAISWTNLKAMEFMQIAFNSSTYSDIQRLILHEKAHFLWDGLFDQKLKDDWAELGGWYIDPSSNSGWSTTKTTEFVSAYSHGNNPNEDMAESIAFYIINPDKLMSRSIRKFEFIRDRVMHGTRYVAQIRKDLTFTVYNLYPDYNYPGKIESVKVNVIGKPNEDKKLVIELQLHAIDSLKDGADYAFTRLSSSIGSIYDLYLYPVNGNHFHLKGERSISKFAKNGYWTVNQIVTTDAVGNQRYENNNTFGLKIFINNPTEDLTPPKYVDNTMKLSLGAGKFNAFVPREDESGKTYQYLQSKFNVKEKNNLDYIGLNFAIPKNDEKGVKQDLQFGVMGNDSNYIKHDTNKLDVKNITYRFPIPEYFPTGYYTSTQIILNDVGQNSSRAYFMKDTTHFQISPGITKHIRDSIYIKTQYPDYLPPILDVNQITISATPTNPVRPDGETHFEMDFFARDTSAYAGHEAGIQNGSYTLRDPQGKQFTFSMQGDFNKLIKQDFLYLLEDPSENPGLWRKYKVSTLLPRGSAPGLWGVESITLYDRANNKKFFSFVELIRFDIEEKDSAQKVSPTVHILNKNVNAQNVDSISMSISCKECAEKLYRARIYSSNGGNSVVYEGTMNKDSIVIKNIKLSGVNDGILYTTVFITNTSKVLLGIGKSSYTKDVVPPKSTVLKTNLSSFGKSNIDSLIIKLNTTEKKGSYILNMKQLKSSKKGMKYETPEQKTIKGPFSNENFQIKDSLLQSFNDGIIQLSFILKDSAENNAEPIIKLLYKDTQDPIITLKNESIDGLKYSYAITSDEYIANNISPTDIKLSKGTVSTVKKITNKNFRIIIDRQCNDSINIFIKPNALKDTVGNGSNNINTTYIDKIVPLKPTITSDGTQISTKSIATYYQWFRNDAIIPEGIYVSYIPQNSGSYKLKISDTNGCTNVSDNLLYTLTSLNDFKIKPEPSVKVFPNPAANELIIEFAIVPAESIEIQLISLEGQILETITTNQKSTKISLSNVTNGLYFIKINGKESTQVQKIIVKR